MSAPLNLALLMLAAGAARAEVIGHHQEATTVPSGSRLLVQFKTRYGSAWRHEKPSFSLRTAGLGGCPPVRSGFFCPSPPPDECTEDGQCPLGLLCCMDECHRQCTRPARPGRCPVDESEVDERVAVLRELIPCRPSAPEALECPTGLKCCEVAGNHVCLPPVAEAGSGVQQAAVVVEEVPAKPGGCPHAPRERLRCRMPPRDRCLLDGHCAGSRKCCPSGCGLICQPAGRPGSCPAISWHVARRCWRDGRPKCYRANDHQCPAGLKCCHNGCVFSCVLPDELLSTKQGFCPPPSFVDELRPPCRGPARVNACDADDHCAGPKKCCPGLCSRQCAYPLIDRR